MRDRQARLPELLIPASCLEVLQIAVLYGADAVYIGGEAFGLRAKAKNFSLAEMKEGVEFAHAHGVKVYVTANILAHNDDLDGVRTYFEELNAIVKPDALIISDPAVFTIAKEVMPETEIHISTQANNTNYGTFKFWHSLGAKRVVTARELSLREIREIRDQIPDSMEIETFVHGAMCISYSGRCLLSSLWRVVMPTGGHVPIPAVGNIPWWRSPDPVNICRFTRMREERISSTPRICV